jgi:hypothetical protein
MTKTTRRSSVSLLACVVALAAPAGCDEGPSAPDMTAFGDAGVSTAIVQGYTWDPEAFWWMLGTCVPSGPSCPLPPVQVPGTPIYETAKVTGALVGLFDPTQPMQTMPLPFNADAPSGESGGWTIEGVPLRPAPPYFPIAVKPPSTASGGDGGAGGPVPPAGYLPTFTVKPISTGHTTLCLGQETALVSDGGVLEAVAKHLGLPSAGVLLDPTRFGGVVVSWLYTPGDPSLRVPAFGAFTAASAGTSYDVRWLPPGAGPPPVVARQSRRGFFVNTDGPTSTLGAAVGVTVTTLPPLMGPPTAVTFTATDPATDAATKRPWTFPTLPAIMPAPGLVTFIGLQAIDFSRPPAPAWVCLPQE